MLPFRKHTRFVEYEHIKSGKIDTTPESLWKDHIERHHQRKNEFKFRRVIDLNEEKPAEVASSRLPVIEDEYECPLCGYVAFTDHGLKVHKGKEHK